MIDGRVLPDVAAELVAVGVDSPSLVELAGLDLGPFDPRDAGDLLAATCDELDRPHPDERSGATAAAILVAWGVDSGALSPRRAARLGSRCWSLAGYPEDPSELSELFMLVEEYDAALYGYAVRSIDELDSDVRAVAERLLVGPLASGWVDRPLATTILRMLLAGL